MRSFAFASALAIAAQAAGIVSQIGDGQIQAPVSAAAGTLTSTLVIPLYKTRTLTSIIYDLSPSAVAAPIAPTSVAVPVYKSPSSAAGLSTSTSAIALPVASSIIHKTPAIVPSPSKATESSATSVVVSPDFTSAAACVISQIGDGQPQAPGNCGTSTGVTALASPVALTRASKKTTLTAAVAPFPTSNGTIPAAKTHSYGTAVPTTATGTAAALSTAVGAASLVSVSYGAAFAAVLAFFA